MKTPHKNAEVIKAYADGATIQYQLGSSDWNDLDPKCADFGRDGKYRIQPDAPKWPQTTMKYEAIEFIGSTAPIGATWRYIANAAIAHACETGMVVPADKVSILLEEERALGCIDGKAMAISHNRVREMTIAINVLAASIGPAKITAETLSTIIDQVK